MNYPRGFPGCFPARDASGNLLSLNAGGCLSLAHFALTLVFLPGADAPRCGAGPSRHRRPPCWGAWTARPVQVERPAGRTTWTGRAGHARLCLAGGGGMGTRSPPASYGGPDLAPFGVHPGARGPAGGTMVWPRPGARRRLRAPGQRDACGGPARWRPVVCRFRGVAHLSPPSHEA